MKTSTTQAENFRPTIGRIVTALAVIASVMGGMAMTPALSANDHHDKGGHKGQDRRDYRPEYRPQYREPYHSQPVYVPPPVYYAPQQSPGISFFFPLDFRH
jgi:hypothetical protein